MSTSFCEFCSSEANSTSTVAIRACVTIISSILPNLGDIERGVWKRLEDIVSELAPNFESFMGNIVLPASTYSTDRTIGVISSVVAAAAKLSNKSDVPPKCQTLVWEGLLSAISKKSNTDEEEAKKNICHFLIFHKGGVWLFVPGDPLY